MEERDSPVRDFERWQSERSPEAAQALFERYSQRLCALAAELIDHRMARRVAPDDVVQSAFRTFFRRTSEGEFRIDHSGALWKLLAEITRRKVSQQRRREYAQRRSVKAEVELPDEGQFLAAEEPSPEEALMLCEQVEELLAGMRPLTGDVLRMKLAGHSAAEITAALNISNSTLRRIIDRLELRLNRLRESGDT